MRTPNRKPGKFSSLKIDPVLTPEKFRELQQKLEGLKKVKPVAAAEVSRLAELGDFSENVEYQMAKGRLRGINNAILSLENQLHEAVVLSSPQLGDLVQIGSTVTVVREGQEKVFKILGSVETNPHKGVISYSSPLGAALIGHSVGDMVTVNLANNDAQYEIRAVVN